LEGFQEFFPATSRFTCILELRLMPPLSLC